MRSIMMGVVRRVGLLAAAGLTATGAVAQVTTLDATGVLEPASSFTLSFPDFGGFSTEALITSTEFDLQVDPTAGTAAFTYYYQHADSLVIPISQTEFAVTGPLRIEIEPGSSAGTFDPLTGEFSTTENYVIYFAGDLSVFGLESPVVLPGNSSGVVTDDGSLSVGSVELAWLGQGVLTPDGGQTLISFDYRCDVNAEFEQFNGCPNAGCEATDLNHDCVSDLADLGILLAHYGGSGTLVGPRYGDVSGDGSVDLLDLSIVLGAFGTDCR